MLGSFRLPSVTEQILNEEILQVVLLQYMHRMSNIIPCNQLFCSDWHNANCTSLVHITGINPNAISYIICVNGLIPFEPKDP